MNPNIYDVSYVRCQSRRHSAARIVRYLTRRPENKAAPTREARWRTLDAEHTFGDARAFRETANTRRRDRIKSARARNKNIEQDHSPKNVQYLHIVISPSRREDFDREDFGALIEPWIRDRQGRLCEYFAVIHHDDDPGPKIHLVVARDRIHKTKELPRLKEATGGIIQEREAKIDRSRDLYREAQPAPEPEPELQAHPDPEPAPEPGAASKDGDHQKNRRGGSGRDEDLEGSAPDRDTGRPDTGRLNDAIKRARDRGDLPSRNGGSREREEDRDVGRDI